MNTFDHGAWGGQLGLGALGGAFVGGFVILTLIIVLWSFAWKGLALWHAARNGQFWWFVVLLIVNTLGILEIIYLFAFRADRATAPLFGKKNPPAMPSSPAQ